MKIFIISLILSTSALASLKNNPMRKMKSAELIVAETIIDKNCDSNTKYAIVEGPQGKSHQYICQQNMTITLFEGNSSVMKFVENKSNEEIITISPPHEITRLKARLKKITNYDPQPSAAEQKQKETFKQETIKKWSK